MIDLDELATEYKASSEYWQTRWNNAEHRVKELQIELQLTRQQWEGECIARAAQLATVEHERDTLQRTISQIQSALDTEETEDALVMVAKEAHEAELELARIEKAWNDRRRTRQANT